MKGKALSLDQLTKIVGISRTMGTTRIKHVIRKFLDSVTFHGLAYLQFPKARIIWSIVITSFFVETVILIINTLYYDTNPTIIVIEETNLPISTVQVKVEL